MDQRRGFVYIHINIGQDAILDPDDDMFNAVIDVACPIRTVSALLFVRPESNEFNPAIFHNVNKHTQSRGKLYHLNPNDYAQVHFILSAFGVPVGCLPISKEGTLDLSWHIQYVMSRRSLEEKHRRTSDNSSLEDAPKPSNGDFVGIESPGQNDVLCGVESLARNHIGNFKYLSYIEAHFEEYNSIEDRLERKAFFDKVFSLVVGPGGRFLQRHEATGLWIPVKDSVLH